MQKKMRSAFLLLLGLLLLSIGSDQPAPVAGAGRAPGVQVPGEEPPRTQRTTLCPFPRIARRLRNKEPLQIVGIGSSSMRGAGASASTRTYPAQLDAYLTRALPGIEVTVHNKGVDGDLASQTLIRFEADVFPLEPDLVIWQVGTNDALRNVPAAEFERVVDSGAAQLAQRKIDLALLDLQYVGGGDDSTLARYQVHIERIAQQRGLPRIPRWRLMKGSVESGHYTLRELVTADGLHTTDIPYQQTAAYTARLIVQNCAVISRR